MTCQPISKPPTALQKGFLGHEHCSRVADKHISMPSLVPEDKVIHERKQAWIGPGKESGQQCITYYTKVVQLKYRAGSHAGVVYAGPCISWEAHLELLLLVLPVGVLTSVVLCIRHDILLHLGGVLQPASS